MYTDTSQAPEKNLKRPVSAWLLLGCAVVGLLVVLGAGFLIGMWYQSHEQFASDRTHQHLGREITVSENVGEQAQDGMTFYETLMASQVTYAPLRTESDAAGEPLSTAEVGTTSHAPGASEPASIAPAPMSSAETTRPPHIALRARHVKQGRDSVRAARRQLPPVRRHRGTPRLPSATTTEAPARSVASLPPRPGVVSQGKRARRTPGAVAPSPAPPVARDGFSVQVGSFKTPEHAEHLRQRLAQTGYAVQVQPAEVPGQGKRYRVRIGSYATPESAKQAAGHLTVHEHVPAMIAR